MLQIRGYALAPKALIESPTQILYMYREDPDGIYDTGWRFFSGSETDEYVNNPDNIGLYDILTIVAKYPYVRDYLTLPPGSAVERNDQFSDFIISKL